MLFFISHGSNKNAKSYKYVKKVLVGTHSDGTQKYRYFYSNAEYESFRNAKGKIAKNPNGSGLINRDLIGTNDYYEDYKHSGYSDKDNPYSSDKVSKRLLAKSTSEKAKSREILKRKTIKDSALEFAKNFFAVTINNPFEKK